MNATCVKSMCQTCCLWVSLRRQGFLVPGVSCCGVSQLPARKVHSNLNVHVAPESEAMA